MALSQLSSQFKNILKQNTQSFLSNDDQIGVLFSGGLDSLSCVLSLLELGYRPILYTMHRDDYLSHDARSAIKAAKTLNLKIRIITIHYNDSTKLKQDIIEIMKRYRAYHKTVIECNIPLLYFFRELRDTPPIYEQEKSITKLFTGYGADLLFGTRKDLTLGFRNSNAEAFKQKRLQAVSLYSVSRFDDPKVKGDFAIFKQIASDYGDKTIPAPYLQKSMIDFFLPFSWQDLNKPEPKWLILQAFPEWFHKYPFLKRHHEAMQTESKFRDLFVEVLQEDNIIKYYHKLYNEIWPPLQQRQQPRSKNNNNTTKRSHYSQDVAVAHSATS